MSTRQISQMYVLAASAFLACLIGCEERGGQSRPVTAREATTSAYSDGVATVDKVRPPTNQVDQQVPPNSQTLAFPEQEATEQSKKMGQLRRELGELTETAVLTQKELLRAKLDSYQLPEDEVQQTDAPSPIRERL